MPYENINWFAPAQARQQEAARFQEMIGQGIARAERAQDRELKRRQLEQKAASDYKQVAMDELNRIALGGQPTERGQAAISVMQQTSAPQVYPDPVTGQMITRPSPWDSINAPQQGDFSNTSQQGNFSNLLGAVIKQESGGNPMALSPKGAAGIMQIMPDTARDPGYGVKPLQGWDGKDPRTAPKEEQIRFGSDYLKAMIRENKGDIRKGLAAYNAGQGAVEQYGGIPPYEETQKYVQNITQDAGLQTEPIQPRGVMAGTPVGQMKAFEADLDTQKAANLKKIEADVAFKKKQMESAKGKEKVTGTITKAMSDLEQINDRLLAKQAVISNNANILDNLKAKYGETWVGKEVNSISKPEIESLKQTYSTIRDSIIPSYIAYFELPATVVDTEEFQQRILKSFGDPTLTYETNKASLENMRGQFGLPKESIKQRSGKKPTREQIEAELQRRRGQ